MEIRELELGDWELGFCETLSSLSPCHLLRGDFTILYYRYSAQGALRKTFVGLVDQRIVATGTVLLEHKFTHDGGIAAHIEDVAVHHDFKRKGYGKQIVDYLVKYANQQKCYKVILDCASWNVEFYEKVGFDSHGHCMKMDLSGRTI